MALTISLPQSTNDNFDFDRIQLLLAPTTTEDNFISFFGELISLCEKHNQVVTELFIPKETENK